MEAEEGEGGLRLLRGGGWKGCGGAVRCGVALRVQCAGGGAAVWFALAASLWLPKFDSVHPCLTVFYLLTFVLGMWVRAWFCVCLLKMSLKNVS